MNITQKEFYWGLAAALGAVLATAGAMLSAAGWVFATNLALKDVESDVGNIENNVGKLAWPVSLEFADNERELKLSEETFILQMRRAIDKSFEEKIPEIIMDLKAQEENQERESFQKALEILNENNENLLKILKMLSLPERQSNSEVQQPPES